MTWEAMCARSYRGRGRRARHAAGARGGPGSDRLLAAGTRMGRVGRRGSSGRAEGARARSRSWLRADSLPDAHVPGRVAVSTRE